MAPPRCLEQGVLRSVADANIGSIMGIGGFPACYGGRHPARERYEGGVADFVTRGQLLAAAYGDRLEPASLRDEQAAEVEPLR